MAVVTPSTPSKRASKRARESPGIDEYGSLLETQESFANVPPSERKRDKVKAIYNEWVAPRHADRRAAPPAPRSSTRTEASRSRRALSLNIPASLMPKASNTLSRPQQRQNMVEADKQTQPPRAAPSKSPPVTQPTSAVDVDAILREVRFCHPTAGVSVDSDPAAREQAARIMQDVRELRHRPGPNVARNV